MTNPKVAKIQLLIGAFCFSEAELERIFRAIVLGILEEEND